MKRLLFLILFLVFSPLVFCATNYADDANCVGHYPMEEDGNETDESTGGAESLTEWGGDIPQSATKKFGTYSRDWESGNTESLYQSDGGDLDISGADQKISVVIWYDPESTSRSGWYGNAGKYNTGANQRQYMMMWNDDAVHSGGFCIDDDGLGGVCANGSTAFTTFAHMGGVYNDVDIRYYQDGSLDGGPEAHTAGIYDGTENFNCGRYRSNTTGYYIDGLQDDLAIFDREITSVEMGDIYNYGVTGEGDVVAGRRIIMTQNSLNSTLSKYLRKRLGIEFEPTIILVRHKGKPRAIIFQKG